MNLCAMFGSDQSSHLATYKEHMQMDTDIMNFIDKDNISHKMNRFAIQYTVTFHTFSIVKKLNMNTSKCL